MKLTLGFSNSFVEHENIKEQNCWLSSAVERYGDR